MEREQIIRIAESNLNGSEPVRIAIRKVKGVGFMYCNAIAKACKFGNKKLVELSEQEQKILEDMLVNPDKYGIPAWLCNRKTEPLTGKTKHLIASNLELTQRMDINELKKIKCYRGVRHGLGLPVRGQRTKSSFRKGKIVGVRKTRVAAPAEAGKKPEKAVKPAESKPKES